MVKVDVRSRLEQMLSPPMGDQACTDYAIQEETLLYTLLKLWVVENSPAYLRLCNGLDVGWEFRNHLER